MAERVAADAPRPDAARIARLVLAPGFSTREAATQLAGRGIGLDVVQRAVAGLRGRLSLASEPGQGLTVSLSLPVSMAGLPVLVARTATHVLALSVRQIEHILPGAQPRPGADGQPVIDTPQGPVPARRLGISPSRTTCVQAAALSVQLSMMEWSADRSLTATPGWW